ncbi:hypothetical protein ACRAWF_36715 [Streptomyces sp. L7]
MSTLVLRWLLSPRTSWHAWRLVLASDDDLSFDAAWRRTRVDRHPEERPYLEYGHRSPVDPVPRSGLPPHAARPTDGER